MMFPFFRFNERTGVLLMIRDDPATTPAHRGEVDLDQENPSLIGLFIARSIEEMRNEQQRNSE
jgi:hypothetical protein